MSKLAQTWHNLSIVANKWLQSLGCTFWISKIFHPPRSPHLAHQSGHSLRWCPHPPPGQKAGGFECGSCGHLGWHTVISLYGFAPCVCPKVYPIVEFFHFIARIGAEGETSWQYAHFGCKEKSKIQLYLLQLQWLHQHLQKKWAKKIQPTPIPSTSPNLIAVSLHRVVLRDLGTDTPHPRHGGLWLIFQTGCIYNQVISSAISMPCKSITLISVLCQFSFDWQLRS